MDDRISLQDMTARLREQGLRYCLTDLTDSCRILVTEYGGRVFGPFDRDGRGILWASGAFRDADAFGRFVEKKEWNLGGDRLWIGPELDFFCRTPETFDETYTVQQQMDPGSYVLEEMPDGIRLCCHASVRRPGTGDERRYEVVRMLRPAADPLACLDPEGRTGVRYCGYMQDITLTDKNPGKEMYLEPWLLTQVRPGGHVLVPYLGDFSFVDYYDPVDETCQEVRDGYVCLHLTGERKYKTAYRSAGTFGRMGYINRIGEGEWCLMIRNYYNDPSLPYVSGPWKNPGDRGCSMYFYNDDGAKGGFAEFENSCMPIGLDMGRTCSHSTTSLWFFTGDREGLMDVIWNLLGIRYEIGSE